MEDNVVFSSNRQLKWTAALGAVVLAGSTLMLTLPASAAELATVHDFETDAGGWFSYGSTVASGVVAGELCTVVPAHTGNPWDVALQHDDVEYVDGTEYTVSFDAYATRDVTLPMQGGAGYPNAFGESVALTTSPQPIEYTFTPTGWSAPAGNVSFQIGNQGAAFDFCIDNFSITSEVENLIPNGDFASGELAPWFSGGDLGTPTFDSGGLCVVVPAASGQYSGVGFNGLAIEEGETYELTYTASTSADRTVRTLIGENGGAYRTVLDAQTAMTSTPTVFQHTFQANLGFPATTTVGGPYEGQLAFQVGGRGTEYTFCIDDVSLVESATPPPLYAPETGPRVRVNQVGYLPEGPKQATLVTDETAAVAWELQQAGVAVASGTTVPAGVDATAGLNVHVIDFSDVATQGTYTLVADDDTSYEFVIDAGIYEQLRFDALNYFYPARSGIAIDGAIVGDPEFDRPAGHIGVAPNQGDYAVSCITPDEAQNLYGDWTCDYTLDVVGGWYDAGDHGKYVVNGGIAVAQVLSTYERTLYAPTADSSNLGDGTLNIPLDEQANGVPDPLDEARWQLEWMMSMQVPAGEELAGMVHHKIHDLDWTGLPLLPSNDAQERRLHRPSTAATLNFAAVAAQGSRLWAEYDAEFANELLEAGQVAYAAALANPAILQPAPNADSSPGGGPYDDSNVGDEFYWAAAELFLTTGEQQFEDAVLASPYNTDDIWTASGINWGETAGLGRLNLATVESDIPGRTAIRESVVAGAERYLAWQQGQPFGTAYPGNDGIYEWGSNSMVLNNQVVLGTAFDLTSDQRFADAVVESMDYLLGRNALNNSYITGYGDVFSENQHSRWLGNSVDSSQPNPPSGSVAGGPNSDTGTWDPVIQGLYTSDYMCAPQFCYIDDIQSWSTNEITVNWNSVLSWVASFVADQQAGDESAAGDVVWVVENPSDTTVVDGAVATFSASASGDPAATVQWQVLDGASWSDMSGATNPDLSFTATLADDGAQYRAVFRNTFGGDYTTAATLTVLPASASDPAVTVADNTLAPGQRVLVSASGFEAGEQIEFRLTPGSILLATATANADGEASATVTIPSGTALGSYAITAVGLDSGLSAAVAVNVVAAATPGSLSDTGVNMMLPTIVIGSLLFIALGGLLLLWARRPRLVVS